MKKRNRPSILLKNCLVYRLCSSENDAKSLCEIRYCLCKKKGLIASVNQRVYHSREADIYFLFKYIYLENFIFTYMYFFFNIFCCFLVYFRASERVIILSKSKSFVLIHFSRSTYV